MKNLKILMTIAMMATAGSVYGSDNPDKSGFIWAQDGQIAQVQGLTLEQEGSLGTLLPRLIEGTLSVEDAIATLNEINPDFRMFLTLYLPDGVESKDSEIRGNVTIRYQGRPSEQGYSFKTDESGVLSVSPYIRNANPINSSISDHSIPFSGTVVINSRHGFTDPDEKYTVVKMPEHEIRVDSKEQILPSNPILDVKASVETLSIKDDWFLPNTDYPTDPQGRVVIRSSNTI